LAGQVRNWRSDKHLLGFLHANGGATLQSLDGEDWGDPGQAETGLVESCRRLRRTPIRDLRREDLVELLNQRIGLPYSLALGIETAERAPFSDDDFYPGQLLRATIGAGDGAWQQWPSLRDRLVAILDKLDPMPVELAEAFSSLRDKERGR
jgi:hypothetical protein